MKLAIVVFCCVGCVRTERPDTVQPYMPVSLPALANAPLAYRASQFLAVRGIRVDRDYLGVRQLSSTYTDHYLLLGDGRRIFDPLELEANVGAETELGREIREVKRSQARNRRVNLIAIVSVAAGVALAAVGAAALKGDHAVLAAVPLTLGTVGFFGGAGYWTFAKRGKSTLPIEDEDFLESYNHSLAETLRVCVTGLQVTHCDAAPAPVPASFSPPAAGSPRPAAGPDHVLAPPGGHPGPPPPPGARP